MTTRPWWAPVLQWGLWAVAMGAIMTWLAQTRTRPRAASEASTLAHPRSTLVIGLICGGFFLTLAVWSALLPGKTGSPFISLFFLGFAALGVPLVLDYLNARHTLTADGLRYGKLLGGGGQLRWVDVRKLRYSEGAKWFRLELTDGRVVRISAMLRGLPEFAAAVLAQVPSGAIDADTRAVMQATAQGEQPRVWG
jgi:Bacterial PH domain